MEGPHPQIGHHQPLRAQKEQKQPKSLVAFTDPPAEEDDPSVKCKDCGAFGHKASNNQCPMKRWDGASVPQPLGSQKMKNQRLCSPQDSRNSGSTARPSSEKEQTSSQEDQQRQALLQRFPKRTLRRLQPSWKDQTESCGYVRHPTQPMPLHTTRTRCVAEPRLISRSPVRKSDMLSTLTPIHSAERSTLVPWVLSKGQGVPVTDSHHLEDTGFVQGPGSKSHGPGPVLIPQAQAKHQDLKSRSVGHAAAHSFCQDSNVSPKSPGKRVARSLVQTCQKPPKMQRLSPCPTPSETMTRAELRCVQPVLPPASAPALTSALAPQAPRKTYAQEHSVDQWPPLNGPLLSTVNTCPVFQHSLAPQRPSQPLRMLLRRLKTGQWRSKLLTTPLLLPAEEAAPPAQNLPSPCV